MPPKTAAVIVARMGSSRLPGKVLRTILGKPMMEHMVERVARTRGIGPIILATSRAPEDDPLEQLARRLGIDCYRGSPDDVLGRVKEAVEAARCDIAVELLGDNPLVHSDLIEDVIAFCDPSRFDYVANVTTEYPHAPDGLARFPVGIRIQAYSPETIFKCARLAKEARHREHSTSYIYEHPKIFRLGYFEALGKWAPLKRPELTFAVNYRENFDLISAVFEQAYSKDSNFPLSRALEIFNNNADLAPLMGDPRRHR